uniref:NDUFA4 mitochondrial complex associated like 2b n=1 Tax=Salmo trutta TaxID=8032 RepID=A0A673XGA9_SALTR
MDPPKNAFLSKTVTPKPFNVSVYVCDRQLNNTHIHTRSHALLIPQFFFLLVGMTGASCYLIRLAKGPHVSWNRKNNPEPWNTYGPNYQYKVNISPPLLLSEQGEYIPSSTPLSTR